jgi:hypothetical protein
MRSRPLQFLLKPPFQAGTILVFDRLVCAVRKTVKYMVAGGHERNVSRSCAAPCSDQVRLWWKRRGCIVTRQRYLVPSLRHWVIPSFLTAQTRHLHRDKAIAQPLSVAWVAYLTHDDQHRRQHACFTRTAIDTALPPLPSSVPAPNKTCDDRHRSRDQRSIGWYPHQKLRIRHPSDAWRYFWLSIRHGYARQHSRVACRACATTDISRW